jgi:hypothetical protein
VTLNQIYIPLNVESVSILKSQTVDLIEIKNTELKIMSQSEIIFPRCADKIVDLQKKTVLVVSSTRQLYY